MVSFEQFIMEDDSPIYLQIIRFIKQQIASEKIENEEEVPSRRVLSALLGVNPNTIQKAYRMLEEEGLMMSHSGAKSYMSVDEATVERIREELRVNDTMAWIRSMKRMGMDHTEAMQLARTLWEREEEM
jgi:GntR family transcriptional regulator